MNLLKGKECPSKRITKEAWKHYSECELWVDDCKECLVVDRILCVEEVRAERLVKSL